MPHLQVNYHQDPGHGWIEVPRAEVYRLGVANRISRCSYQQGDRVYLEEDCDAPLFIEAARADGIDVLPIDRHTDSDSPIRRMARFQA
jgi:hypothetical protein